jgi:hypothetical protein
MQAAIAPDCGRATGTYCVPFSDRAKNDDPVEMIGRRNIWQMNA